MRGVAHAHHPTARPGLGQEWMDLGTAGKHWYFPLSPHQR